MDLSAVLAIVPAQYAGYAAALVAACAFASAVWPRPADGSKLLPLYLAVNTIGMNFKHATNAAPVTKEPN